MRKHIELDDCIFCQRTTYADLTMEQRIELWFEILSKETDLVYTIRKF